MLRVLSAISPQVDHVFLVLNEYHRIPTELDAFPNVTAIVPECDLKDVGKFYFRPDPDDMVFMLDDDIGYPDDYVTETVRRASGIDLDRHVVSYQGSSFIPGQDGAPHRMDTSIFHHSQAVTLGADFIGTGIACALGKNIAPLEYMRGAQCFTDIRYGNWMYRQGLRGWTLPRPEKYLTNILPKDLVPSSIYHAFTRTRPRHVWKELATFLGRSAHARQCYSEFLNDARAVEEA